jgi:hypothetical protein
MRPNSFIMTFSKSLVFFGFLASITLGFLSGCNAQKKDDIKYIPTIEPMTESKEAWIKDCNSIKDHYDRLKINAFARCLTVCGKVSNARTTSNKIREENSKACKVECDKAKIDLFEDIFFVERKTDDKYHCHFTY